MILKIDNEFKKLIRPLNEKEYEALEKSIIQFGVMDTIKSWPTPDGELIVDGHNRFNIARKHGVEYGCSRLDFSERDQAKMWILKNQLARRNMNAADYKEMQIAVTALLTKIQVRNSRAESNKALPQSTTKRRPLVEVKKVQTRTVDAAAKAAGVPVHKLQAAVKLSEEQLERVVAGVDHLPTPPPPRKQSTPQPEQVFHTCTCKACGNVHQAKDVE